MIDGPFDDIAKRNIEALITKGVPESKTLEYKQELPGTTDRDKREFLADVSSFANASGGDILYGIKEAVDAAGKKTGSVSVQPITGTTGDAAKLRLDDIIRYGIVPRLRVDIKEIAGWDDEGGFVLLLRIPKSFSSPHMVKDSSKFYSRSSARKDPLDVGELRAAFLATESQAERIKRFREDRLGKIVADEAPVVLESSYRLVLHLIPVGPFLNNERLDLAKIELDNERRDNINRVWQPFLPIAPRELIFERYGKIRRYGGISPAGKWGGRRDLDGILTWISIGQGTCGHNGYCQLFSHGAVEAADTVVLGWNTEGIPNGNPNRIVPTYECDVVNAVKGYLKDYRMIGVTPPVAIALSLLGCKGASFDPEFWPGPFPGHPIDRDAVILPEVLIDSFDADVPQAMKPIFDTVWNALGFAASINYDQDGNWAPP